MRIAWNLIVVYNIIRQIYGRCCEYSPIHSKAPKYIPHVGICTVSDSLLQSAIVLY